MKSKIAVILSSVIFVAVLVFAGRVMNAPDTDEIELETSKSVIEVNQNTFESEVLNSDRVVLIDFYADWCMPCKELSPKIEKIANENPDLKVVKINVDESEDLANEYFVNSIPTVVVIQNGIEIDRVVGSVEKEVILNMLP